MTTSPLQIVVTAGTGAAPTGLASFDAALQVAGVADFNIVRLSSLIPPGSAVHAPERWDPLPGRWGDRLYAVYAEHRVWEPGRRACAGLGWVQDLDTGAGMLVEHHGEGGDDEGQVVERIRATLDDLAVRRPGRYGQHRWRTAQVLCEDQPVTAVVVAAFQVEPW